VATGSYTGDGTAAKAITGVGFTPKYLRIEERETVGASDTVSYITTTAIIDDHEDGGCIRIHSSTHAFYDGYIVSLDADGFTVSIGVGADPNTNGKEYNYICMG
ncbi:unnamed protein product, partial [marine sediment metagenome]